MLYNQLEYLYGASPLIYRGETPYHEMSVYGINLLYNINSGFILVSFFVSLKYIMSCVRYVKFRYRGEWLWLRVSSTNEITVVGRVWNRPTNPGLLFGQMIQVPLGDVLDM